MLRKRIEAESCAKHSARLRDGESHVSHMIPKIALEELTEDATLPNPVHVRDMILRKHPSTDKALELNRLFLEYQKVFWQEGARSWGKRFLKQLAG